MTAYFGEPWDVPALQGAVKVTTPAGMTCLLCQEPIADGDQGFMRANLYVLLPVPIHRECELRSILGGVNHLEGNCSCCPGGTRDPDPPGLTYREAARLVLEWSIEHGGAP